MGAPRSLDPYRSKRDPARTNEPFGPPAGRTATPGAQRFVVQQHAARRLHWDLRLEIDGVLVSWAVPRGPSADTKEKRLAVQTEDHPLEYRTFEGIIPAGNYGAGAMIIWDIGRYVILDGLEPGAALASGKLDLEFFGHKLRGRWALVRTKGEDGRQWLLFKKPDAAAGGGELVDVMPQSVVSGLTVVELRDGIRLDDAMAAAATAAGASRAALPLKALSPMLADVADKPFTRAGWLFELKYDGIRVLLVRRDGGAVQLRGRSGRDVTAQFPEVAAAAAHLPCADFVIDGELIALDERGAGSFERLQGRLGLVNAWDVERAAAATPVQVFAFDLLAVAAHDLRQLPLIARKALLARLVPVRGVTRYADHIADAGEAFYEVASAHEVEGIVAKRADSPYRSGQRSADWLKIKRPRYGQLAVVGYVPGKGTRAPMGALMLGWRHDGGFVHAGNVGSGLSEGLVRSLLATLEPSRRATPAFAVGADPLPRGAIFVEPRLVAKVRYTEVTERGMLRQPVLETMLDDVALQDADDLPSPTAPTAADPVPAPAEPATKKKTPRRTAEPAPPRFTPSNEKKIFWPAEGYTKGDLLAYYDAIWPAIAPYLRDRPVVLTRYPDGIEGKSFFQKNAPEFIPDWVPTCRVEDTEYFLCNERDALLYVINMGCIPVHVWSARRDSIERPDWSILDLDPKGAPRRDVLAIAHKIHQLLEPLGAPHYIKTSGQQGLHILIPLGGALTHDQSTAFAEVLARLVAGALPDIATVARSLRDRGGKVYVDYLQNGFGKTIVAPFSVRPIAGAPVSTPLTWDEVTADLDPAHYTIRTVPERMGTVGDPLQAVLETRADIPAIIAALQDQLRG